MGKMLFYTAAGKMKVTLKDFPMVAAQERSYARLLLLSSQLPFELYLSKYTMGHGI